MKCSWIKLVVFLCHSLLPPIDQKQTLEWNRPISAVLEILKKIIRVKAELPLAKLHCRMKAEALLAALQLTAERLLATPDRMWVRWPVGQLAAWQDVELVMEGWAEAAGKEGFMRPTKCPPDARSPLHRAPVQVSGKYKF